MNCNAAAEIDTTIDGVHLSVRVVAESEEGDPAIVRDMMDRVSQAVEAEIIHQEELLGEHARAA